VWHRVLRKQRRLVKGNVRHRLTGLLMERRHVFLSSTRRSSCAWTRKFHFSAHRQPRSGFITFGFNLPKQVLGADKERAKPVVAPGPAAAPQRHLEKIRRYLETVSFGANEATRLHRGYGVVRRRIDHLGASELTIFSKRGSPRSGSHIGFKRRSP